MVNEFEIKKQICEIGKRIYNKGMVASNDGNISVKISDNEFLCTPTGVSKGFMTPEYICKVDANGKVIQANPGFKPSSEIKMHMRVYRERPDVTSVVHAHPLYATSFAIAGIPLTEPIMPEAVIALGCVPIAEYGTPSTEEIPDAISKYLQHYDAVLLENPYVTFKFFKNIQNDNSAFFDKFRKNWLHILTDDYQENYNRTTVYPEVSAKMNEELKGVQQSFKENRRGIIK